MVTTLSLPVCEKNVVVRVIVAEAVRAVSKEALFQM